MADRIEEGTWVEIYRVVLQAGERAPKVPEDTQQVPLEMRTRGFLTHPATPGEDAEITTVTGRRLRGTLSEVEPAYTHSFGPPVTELLTVGVEVRERLRSQGKPR